MQSRAKKTTVSKQKKASQAVAKKEGSNAASPMNSERLRKLYALMLKCRLLDTFLGSLRREHQSHQGREAVTVGAAIHLKASDLIAPSSSDSFCRFVQGVSLATIIGDLQANAEARNAPYFIRGAARFSDHLNFSAGMALAAQGCGQAVITLSVVHDVPVATDSWREPLALAAGRKLPLVFLVCHPASQSPDLRRDAQPLLPAITVDGNDAVAVYRVVEETSRRARQGLGPSLIECLVDSGDSGRDPLLFMENYLRQRHFWSDGWKPQLVRAFTAELESAARTHFGKTVTRRAMTAISR